MATTRGLSGTWVEPAALLGGIAAATLLVTMSILLRGAPERLGRSALADFAANVEQRTLRLWEQQLADLELEALVAGPEPPAPPALARDISAPGSSGAIAFDALLQRAREKRLQGAVEEARDLLQSALAFPVDEVRRLRALQAALVLEVRAGRHTAALEAWQRIRTEASGAEVDEDGDSIFWLSALTVADVIEGEAGLEALRSDWIDRWASGSLALSEEPVSIVEEEALQARTSSRLQLLLGQSEATWGQDPRLAADLEARHAWALIEAYAWPQDDLPRGTTVASRLRGSNLLLAWPRTDGWSVRSLKLSALGKGFETRWASAVTDTRGVEFQLLPPGEESRGEPLRSPATLPGMPLRLALLHGDIAGFVQAEARVLRLLRWGLLGLAGLLAVGGAGTFGALRRRRRLQELKETFIANVSHELRTPVTGLRLTAESLVEGRAESPERRARYHALILKESERLERLVADVLDFSRLQRGHEAKLRTRSVDLRVFSSGLLDAAQQEVEATGLRFEAQTAELPVDGMEFDDEALTRAVLNLVRNACLHSGSDLLRLEVRGMGAGGTRGLEVRVLDRGRGIPSREQQRIFEPFRQATISGEKPKGTGLGLPIAREIAVAHRGTLRVTAGLPRESESSGHGAGFVLCIPAGSRT